MILTLWSITTLCDKVCQWLEAGQWFSPGTPVSSTNKTDCHNITEILLKVALNTINQTKPNCLVKSCNHSSSCISIQFQFVWTEFRVINLVVWSALWDLLSWIWTFGTNHMVFPYRFELSYLTYKNIVSFFMSSLWHFFNVSWHKIEGISDQAGTY